MTNAAAIAPLPQTADRSGVVGVTASPSHREQPRSLCTDNSDAIATTAETRSTNTSATSHETRSAATSRLSTLASVQAFAGVVDGGRRLWREHAVQIACSLLLVLRNAFVSVAFAWFVMSCFSRGNVVSGRAAREQSTLEFDVSLLLWWKLFSWAGVAATTSVSLTAQRFTTKPDAEPSFFVCWMKVLRGTYRLVVVTTAVVLAVTIPLLHISAPVRTLRIHVYMSAFVYHVDTVACNIATTRVFDTETVRGQEKQCASGSRRPRYWRRLAKLYVVTFPSISTFCVTALYTGVTASVQLATASQLLIFTLCSFALKIVLQEVSKFGVFKQNTQNAAIMAALVGVPTILIDTQMRIVVLRGKSTSATLSGTLVIAIVEISVRCAKSYYVKYQIKRERTRQAARANVEPATQPTTGSTDALPATTSEATSEVTTEPTAVARPPSAASGDFDKWRQRLLHYHAAEVYADMFAEYVALGCSYVILYFCWNHPKYMLSRFHDTVAATHSDSRIGSSSSDSDVNSASLTSLVGGSQVVVMACQLSAEIVVDYASCLLEVGNGIDFRPLQRQSFYLGLWLIWAASTNVAISANILVRSEP